MYKALIGISRGVGGLRKNLWGVWIFSGTRHLPFTAGLADSIAHLTTKPPKWPDGLAKIQLINHGALLNNLVKLQRIYYFTV